MTITANPCTHGMPGPGSCIDCQMDGVMPPAPRRTTRVGHSFAASFPGQCPTCDLPITEGQQLTAVEHLVGENVELTTYPHKECAS